MTISEAISQTRKLSGNAVDDNTMCRWLSELDGRLMLDFYKGGEWMSYSLPDDEDHELLVPFPWDELYVHYLEAMVYYSNGEFERYRNSYEMYNKKELDFRQWYARTHVPITLDMLQKRDCTVVMEPQDQRCSRPFWYLSAYGIAVRHGYQGSVDEWLAELVGPPGKDGAPGERGEPGAPGEDGATGPAGADGGYYMPAVDTAGNISFSPSKESMPSVSGGNIRGPIGPQGNPGKSVVSTQKTAGTGAPGTTDTYTQYNDAGESVGTFQVYNGKDGAGTGDFKANGTVPMTGNLQMGGHKVTGLADGVEDSDAVNKGQLDAAVEDLTITTDATPAQGSANPVQSGGVYTALAGKADTELYNLSAPQSALYNLGAAPNRNLLDNWYFVGGGSQQGGGQFPINQRGQTSWSAAGHMFDRWKLVSGTASLTAAGVTLNGTMAQVLENDPPGETTATALTTTGIVDCTYDSGTKTFTITGTGETFLAAKLELGSHQTLAREDADGNWVLLDPPPNFQQELAKCQRYLLILSGFGWIGSGVVDDTSTGQFFLPTPVSMRITPTMAGLFRIYNHINNFQVTTATATGHTENGINGMITFTGGTLQQGDPFFCHLSVNEKLMLSAEL